MNICLFPHDTVEYDGKAYYSNTIPEMISRYSTSEDTVSLVVPVIKVDKSNRNKIESTNIIYHNIDKFNSLKSIINIRKFIKKFQPIIKQADVCVLNIPLIVTQIAFEIAKKLNKPILTVVCGCSWDAYWNYNLKGKLLAPFLYLWQKSILKRSKHSIYVTEKFLQKRYPTGGKSIACSNVEMVMEKNILQKRLSHIKNKREGYKIATIAAVDVPYKGQRYVIEALKKLKENNSSKKFEYHLIGGGDQSALRHLVTKYGLQDSVVFHGIVPHSKILNLLDEMDIYIQPSKQEGLPRSVIEAMSRGCLCMGSNVAGIPELISSKYIFRPDDSNKIAQLLGDVTDSDLIEEGANINIEKAVKYDKSNLDKKRSNFYNEFIKDNKS